MRSRVDSVMSWQWVGAPTVSWESPGELAASCSATATVAGSGCRVHRTWIVGLCWRCEQRNVPVIWLGPIHTDHYGAAPFYACDPCIRRLEAMTRAYQDTRADAE